MLSRAVIGGWRRPRAWLYVVFTLAAMLVLLALMGVFGSESVPKVLVDQDFPLVAFEITLWLYFGLGLMIYAFKYMGQQESKAVGTALLLAFGGYVSFYILFRIQGFVDDDYYAMAFVEHLLSSGVQ